MKSIIFSIGPFTVYGYGLMIALGVVAAYITVSKRAPKFQLNPDLVFDLAIFCLLGGLIGSKLLYWITILPEILEDPSRILDSLANGFVVYGGIIGGILGGFLFCHLKKINFLQYFDLVMPSVALAQGFGRIGCFLAGCCYGMETDSACHVIFPAGSLAPAGVPLLPTQLFSAGLDFAHFFVLCWFASRKKADGQVAALYLIFYSIGRFILEYFRGDLERGSVGTFSTSQFISLFILAAGIGIFVGVQAWKRRQKQ